MRGQPDTAQIAFARREKRVLITHDTDFLRFASRQADHPGILYADRLTRSVGDIIRGAILVFEVMTPAEMTGRVEFL